jgi:hypothetical protein
MEVLKHMKLFRPTAILLVLLLTAMVMVPMVSAALDPILLERYKNDKKFPQGITPLML